MEPQSVSFEDRKYLPLDVLLCRIAAESADIALSVGKLQDEIGNMIERGLVTLSHETIQSLQDADRIYQTLLCLSRAIERIAPDLSEQRIDRTEIAEAVSLDSVAKRLVGDKRSQS